MIILFSVLSLASEAPAATPPAPPPQATAEAPKAERKICRREDATESRLGGKRICLTAAEWQARSAGEVRGMGDVSKQ